MAGFPWLGTSVNSIRLIIAARYQWLDDRAAVLLCGPAWPAKYIPLYTVMDIEETRIVSSSWRLALPAPIAANRRCGSEEVRRWQRNKNWVILITIIPIRAHAWSPLLLLAETFSSENCDSLDRRSRRDQRDQALRAFPLTGRSSAICSTIYEPRCDYFFPLSVVIFETCRVSTCFEASFRFLEIPYARGFSLPQVCPRPDRVLGLSSHGSRVPSHSCSVSSKSSRYRSGLFSLIEFHRARLSWA